MFQKDVIRACFRLFFVVFVVAALAQSSCFDDISSNGYLLGGWMKVNNPQNDSVVKGIMASGLEQYNQQSNDLQQFELFEDGHCKAYQQLVNGINYCVLFNVVNSGCTNSLSSDGCGNGMICSVTAYKSFRDTDATINPEELVCNAAA